MAAWSSVASDRSGSQRAAATPFTPGNNIPTVKYSAQLLRLIIIWRFVGTPTDL